MKRLACATAFGAAFAAFVVVACSSNDTPPHEIIEENKEDARSDVRPPAVDANDAGPTLACVPTAFSGPPRFVPSRSWHRDACTAAQVAAYVKACLESETDVCEAFAKANPTCFACAESDEKAADWGPIVIFANGTYFEENFAGCIANALGDLSANGCGGARARFEECRRAACRGCLPILTQADYDAFSRCGTKREIQKICVTEVADIATKCAGHTDPAPDDPVFPCLGIGLDSNAYFQAYVAMFCSAAVDAGPDASDAAPE